jgi:hypothetical protein
MKLLKKSFINSQKKKLINYSEINLGKKSIIYLFSLIFSPHHFKRVKISATALIKMVMHAKRGGDIEVMGLL